MLDHAPSPLRLRRIGETLARLDLTAAGPGVDGIRRRAAALITDYLLPRLEGTTDHIVIAVVGPSGGGKSTIVNTLAGRRITPAGPVRPTTTEPMAWSDGSVPATLDGLRRRLAGSLVEPLRPPPEGVVIIDTPPPTVLDRDGYSIAHQVLEVVDAVVFVAGSSRYADADSFDLLELAAGRGLPTVIVLNRLPDTPEMHHVLAADFASKLAARRLIPRADPGLIATIAEGAISADTGSLERHVVARVAKDIEAMADPQSRPDVIASAVAGSLRRLRDDLTTVRSHVLDGAVRRVELLDPMRSIYRQESRKLVGDVRTGRFAGLDEGEMLEALAAAAARRAGRAARDTAELWAERAPALVEGSTDLFEHGRETIAVARDRLAFWAAELEDLPKRFGGRAGGRRRRRRLGAALRRMVLDPQYRPPRRLRRRLDRSTGLLDSARAALADEIDGILVSDSLRFAERIGPSAPSRLLTELTEDSRE